MTFFFSVNCILEIKNLERLVASGEGLWWVVAYVHKVVRLQFAMSVL